MSKSPRILLDCDPGIDDAFAIFCATRFTDLAAVTTVSGNVPVEHTTRNALHVLELAGVAAPVHPGAGAPLTVPAMFADEIHGVAGLGPTQTPEPAMAPSTIDATTAILNFCAPGNATIVATGPLTNIANAVLNDPTIADRIDALHWMGGSTAEGNKTSYAEFNAWADPHAVDVVFGSGIPLVMYGLNLTHQVRMTDVHIDVLLAAGSPSAQQAAEFLTFYRDNTKSLNVGQAMHDPCALLGVTHPELFTTSRAPMVAHVDGERRGMTERDASNTQAATHTIAETADALSVLDLIIDAAIEPVVAS